MAALVTEEGRNAATQRDAATVRNTARSAGPADRDPAARSRESRQRAGIPYASSLR